MSSPCLAIAELAGGSHPVEVRAALVELYGGRQVEDESMGIQLLVDIRTVFGERRPDHPVDLLERLNDLDESPWCEWFGKPLTSRGLHKLLERYRIKSRSINVGDRRPKGFLREQFQAAWNRYLPSDRGDKTLLRYNPHSKAENSESESATSTLSVADKNRPRFRSTSGK